MSVCVCVCLCLSALVCVCLCSCAVVVESQPTAACRVPAAVRRSRQAPPRLMIAPFVSKDCPQKTNPIVSVCRNDHQCHARCIAAWRQVRRDQIGISSTCPVCRSPSIRIAGENEQVMCSGLLTRLLGPPGSSDRARAIGRVCGCCLLVTPYGILLMICIPVASRVSQRGFRNPTAERND